MNTIQTYRKKPVEIQAIEWNGDDHVYELFREWGGKMIYRETRNVLLIRTIEGVMEARIGDYIIRGIAGEFYPCKPDIFEKSYDLVESVEQSGGGADVMSFSRLQARDWRAIQSFCNKGYVPQLSVYPNVTFTNKETGEQIEKSLEDLLSEYDVDLKEAAKERARERKVLRR